jgi:hypothetical protein
MPKLFGLNIVAVLVASVAFFAVGYLWYGLIFTEMWMAEMNLTEDDAGSPLWMIGGFVITIMQVVGIGLAMKWKGAAGLNDAVTTAIVLWIVFALPFSAYGYLYTPAHSATLLMIDAAHLLVGWVVGAVILSLMKA